ncbi:hypothetical protein pb186bvf_001310 [Paramecium bursaria]
MFRQLIKRQAYISTLREFVCLRESADPVAQAESIKSFQELAQKYNISVNRLSEIQSVIQLSDLDRPENYPNYDAYRIQKGNLEIKFRQQHSESDLHHIAQTYRYIVPERWNPPARVQAVQVLQKIYLEGIDIQRLKRGIPEQYLTIFAQRNQQEIQEIRQSNIDPELKFQLEQSLRNIFAKVQQYQGQYWGLIKSYADVLNSRDLVVQESDESNQQQQIESAIEKELAKLPSLTEDEKQYLGKDINEIEFKQFLQEVYEEEYTSGVGQNRHNEQNQKLIFEADSVKTKVLTYYSLSGLFGTYFSYLLYLGDARYTTILAVPALAAGFYLLAQENVKLRQFSIIRQILKNPDNTYEIIYEKNRQISKIENIQAENIKASVQSIPNPLRFGRPTDVGYHILINGESYFAPYKYRGNALDFRKVAQF